MPYLEISSNFKVEMFQAVILAVLALFLVESDANPDAKRLYDDLLADYNRLIRPVSNHTDKVTVKLGLRLSQLVDLVRIELYLVSISSTFYEQLLCVQIPKAQKRQTT